jgi:hypothetical protein
MGVMEELLEQYDREHAFLRSLTWPEEDRDRFTTMPWQGEYRWFRSPNVIPLEKVRRLARDVRCVPSTP